MTPSSSEHNNDNQDYELDASFSLKHNEDLTDDEVLSLLSDDNDGQQTLLPSTHHNNQSNASVFSFESIPMIPLTETQVRGPELQKKVSFLNGLGLVIGAMIGSGLFSSPGKRVISCLLFFFLSRRFPHRFPILYFFFFLFWF